MTPMVYVNVLRFESTSVACERILSRTDDPMELGEALRSLVMSQDLLAILDGMRDMKQTFSLLGCPGVREFDRRGQRVTVEVDQEREEVIVAPVRMRRGLALVRFVTDPMTRMSVHDVSLLGNTVLHSYAETLKLTELDRKERRRETRSRGFAAIDPLGSDG